ncbi:hypothetical protein NUSPORA_00217 [Nucleospora cyclopteri]
MVFHPLMQSKITGLKIEDDVLYHSQEQGHKDVWEETPIDMIEEIEKLAKELERITYPSKTRRENVVFENEIDLGSGTVKFFKDKDGDVTYTYQNEDKSDLVLNEDDAFGINFTSNKSKEVETNCWARKADDLKNIEDNRNLYNQELKQSQSEDKDDLNKNKILKPNKTSPYLYKKREKVLHSDLVSIQRDAILSTFFKNVFLKSETLFPKKIKGISEIYSISYMSSKKTVKESGLCGSLIIGQFIYNRKHGIKNTLASKFYLKKQKSINKL